MCALEVNPRPTATFELYDPDYAQGLVDWHVRSFAGPLADFPDRHAQAPASARACAIVYAEHVAARPRRTRTSRAGAAICRWAEAGSQPGAPVLSVFAEARERDAGAAPPAAATAATCSGCWQRWRADARASARRPHRPEYEAMTSVTRHQPAGRASVNALAAPQVERLLAAADALRLRVSRSESGATLVDAGICRAGRPGGRAAHRGDLHGRAGHGHAGAGRCAPSTVSPRCTCTAPIPCWPASPASTPAGA